MFTSGFYWGSCYSICGFTCMFCRSMFVLLSFFFLQLSCLFFFDIRILINPLVSSNSSYKCCPTRFPFHMMFLLKSNTMDVTNGTGTAYPSGTSKIPTVLLGFVLLDLWFSVKCFVDRCFSI